MIFILESKLNEIWKSKINDYDKCKIISNINRINILSMIYNAGSGHIGTSMSAIDLMTWIKLFEFKKSLPLMKNPNRDIFFSSKGHDAPALYSILYIQKLINFKKILKLRKLDGLDGHPDVNINGVEANTGSLGMGISKAKGLAWSKKYLNKKGKVIVMIGDGEFQEGQIFESLQSASHQNINNLIVVMDHNKIQSSQYVKKIIKIEDLQKKIKSFGWSVLRCNGHDFKKINQSFRKFDKIKDKPKFLIADTIKGKGISFMEHVSVMKKNKYYTWHAGAPFKENYEKAIKELLINLRKLILKKNLKIPEFYNLSKKKLEGSIDIH